MMDLLILIGVLLYMLISKIIEIGIIGLTIYGGYNVLKKFFKELKNEITMVKKD